MTVEAIYCYPIKSLNGLSLPSAEVLDTGVKLDRQWMLIDQTNKFITRREKPQLALLNVAIEKDGIVVNDGHQKALIPFSEEQNQDLISSKVWQSHVHGRLARAEINDFFSAFLQQPVQLIQQHVDFPRLEKIPGESHSTITSFADSFPIHVIGSASLNFLNEHLNQPIHAGYFRPNIVIETRIPFEEDHLDVLSFENVTLQKAKLCGRCKMVNIDPTNGEVRNDVLKILARFRTFENSVKLGVLFYVTRKGRLSIGEPCRG